MRTECMDRMVQMMRTPSCKPQSLRPLDYCVVGVEKSHVLRSAGVLCSYISAGFGLSQV